MFKINLHDDAYEVAGRVITTTAHGRTSRYVLPASAARISKVDYNGRSILEMGGFKSVTVTVLGPTKVIDELFEFLS